MTRFHSLEIVEKRQETPDSVSLAFAAPNEVREEFAYEPGQYLTLRATIGGEECRRSYSISSGLDEGELRIAVKRVEGGTFSRFANDVLRAGDRIEIAPPEGRFTAEIGADRHLAFFAAGSGITPVISIIRSALAANAQARATLVYGNKTTSSIMFRAALEELKDRYLGRLAVLHVLSRESQDIDILSGRVDGEKIGLFARTIVRPSDVDAYYLCGPFGMIEDGRAALIAAGVSRERIKAELFSTDGSPKAAPRPSRRILERRAQFKSNACSTAARIALTPSPASASSTRRKSKGSKFRTPAEAACAAPAAASSSRARSRWTSTTRSSPGSSRRATCSPVSPDR